MLWITLPNIARYINQTLVDIKKTCSFTEEKHRESLIDYLLASVSEKGELTAICAELNGKLSEKNDFMHLVIAHSEVFVHLHFLFSCTRPRCMLQ